ncbi:DUF2946 family protein [Alcaligenaceae bacterium CGII-47]|nr:DUF2946 family protein [Alcaligenaceae bacterium CGII-47]
MDPQVIAAMKRWPNVPEVYGWLSLSATGHWRLHPRGTAWRCQADPMADLTADDILGEAITSPQITNFIKRNYTCDTAGRWFFQNGPQRVFIRLDAAPYLLQTDLDEHGRLHLRTHTGEPAGQVSEWWLDDQGRVFARTAIGPGMIAGRDLSAVIDVLHTPQGPLAEALANLPDTDLPRHILPWPAPDKGSPVALHHVTSPQLPAALGFVTCPQP